MRTVRTRNTVLCCLWLLALGCEEDVAQAPRDGGGAVTAPDASIDVAALANAIDALHATDEALGEDLAGLATELADAGAAFDALDERVNDLDDRVKTLEQCRDGTCLEQAVAEAVELLRPIIVAACEDMAACCTEAQLAKYYTPSYATAEDCVALNISYIERFFGVDLPFHGFWGFASIAPKLANGGVEIVSDRSVVDACVERIRENACGVLPPIDLCDDEAWFARAKNPCDPTNFVKGTRQLGEPCGEPEGYCVEGLSCRNGSFCTPLPLEGDLCANDGDCITADYESGRFANGLYCNLNVGRCEPFRQLGEPCETLRPVFEGSRDNDPVECDERLSCHPERKVCVPACSEGALCMVVEPCYEMDCDETFCGPDLTCAVDYWGDSGRGRCREPFALGAPCEISSECASGICRYDSQDGRRECAPPSTADGGPCALETPGTGQSDPGCLSGWCASDGVCAMLCADDLPCEAGRICVDTFDGTYCEAPIANGGECVYPAGASVDDGCASGFCDDDEVCAAKAEANGECPSGRHRQCPSAQYCDEGTCVDRIDLGEACDTDAACVEGGYCAVAGPNADACAAFALSGEPCDESADARCAQGFDCVSIGTESTCLGAGEYPNGASCINHASCASGWCDLGMCRARLAEDEPCEAAWDTSPCAEDLECIGSVCSATAPTCRLDLYF